MTRKAIPLSAIILGLFLAPGCARQSEAGREVVVGAEALHRLDLLAKLKPSVEVGCVSSYDRSGGNDDGFSGRSSFLRKEEGGLVIADLKGPGIITRIHLPSPTDDVIEFYFDGESRPRIRRKIPELFDGRHPPFMSPLVGAGAGGRYSYIPLPYQHSCKVLVRADVFHFYQINYIRYSDNFVVPSYQEPCPKDYLGHLEKAAALFERSGSDISDALVHPGDRLERKSVRARLKPDHSVELLKLSGPGRIVGMKIGPASVFAGQSRDILLRMTWDGAPEPAVNCPAGDFFGYSFGDPAVRSLLLGTAEGTNYCYFPMPFVNSARIELVSESTSGGSFDIQAEFIHSPLGKADDEGRFYARWSRENPTRRGIPFTYLRTTGRGHVVGMILQAQGLEPGKTPFFEGDDRAVIDGKLAIPGTGSEDSFNGGWYDVPGRWESRTSLPLSGCLDYLKPLARTGGYRWLVTDAYAYSKSIEYTIEHAPEGNAIPTDYTGIVFFYSSEPPPAAPLLPAADRRMAAPERIVFVPGWNVPIHTTSLQNASWTKMSTMVGEERVRFLSMETTGEDIFGPHHLAFICRIPSAGPYKVGIRAVLGPDQGILRMFQRDLPVGDPADLYAETRRLSGVLPLGLQDMTAGDNLIFLYLTGKNPHSSGMGLDLAEIILQKVP